MKTLILTFYLTFMKAASLTSCFLLFAQGIKKHDDLLIVLSFIMGTFFLTSLTFNFLIKQK